MIKARRGGFSLLLVLSLCAMLSICMAFILLSVQWAWDSTLLEERRLRDRSALSALMSEGRRWLENEVSAGRLPGGDDVPALSDFSDARIRHIENDGTVLDIYDLNYDIGKVPAGAYLRSKGAGRFFPPGENMFLLRAFRPEADDGGVMIEAVFEAVTADGVGHGWRLESRPVLWWEVWP